MSRVHHVDQARRVADAVGEALEGQRLASHLLARLRTEFVDHDALHRLIVQAHQASPDRLAGGSGPPGDCGAAEPRRSEGGAMTHTAGIVALAALVSVVTIAVADAVLEALQ